MMFFYSVGCLTILLVQQASALTFPFGTNTKKSPTGGHTIQVCQNKDCCKRWSMAYQRLPLTLQDLLPPDAADQVRVETTGCLSQCGKGPNVCIKKRGSKEVQLNGITGPLTLAGELEEHFGIQVPSKLIAAVTVMEKAHNAALPEKERFYSSVIQVLSSDPLLNGSSANARAMVSRAQARHEAGRWEEALEDARNALQVIQSVSRSASEASTSIAAAAWRTLADCFSSQGNVKEAVEALREWARADLSFQSKATYEIELLLESTMNDSTG